MIDPNEDPALAARLEFWFEFASTYSYLAASRILALAQRQGVEIVYRPFLLAPIFKKQGWNDSPFNIYPVKGRYMWRDLERLCAQHGLPFRRPSVFPRSGLLAARVALVAAERGFADRFVPAVYGANFARDENIADPAVLAPIIIGVGEDAASVLESAQADSNKELLRRQTERAEELGIFGAPSFVTRGELFWGNDRLEQALEWASGGDGGGACEFPNDF